MSPRYRTGTDTSTFAASPYVARRCLLQYSDQSVRSAEQSPPTRTIRNSLLRHGLTEEDINEGVKTSLQGHFLIRNFLKQQRDDPIQLRAEHLEPSPSPPAAEEPALARRVKRARCQR
eukprot:scaffold29830_cov21-Prasinocladus_malaysianus.AAC.1